MCIEKDRGPSAYGATRPRGLRRQLEDKRIYMKELWIRNIYGECTIMRGDFPFDIADACHIYKLNTESFKEKMIEFNAKSKKVYYSFDNCSFTFNNETDAIAAKNWIESQIIVNKNMGIS